MAKKILELKQFMDGIVASPSDTDIPPESPVFSKNLDAISEEGKIKGVNKDVIVSNSDIVTSVCNVFPNTSTFMGYTQAPKIANNNFKVYVNNVKIVDYTESTTDTSLTTFDYLTELAAVITTANSNYTLSPTVSTANTSETQGYNNIGTLATAITDTTSQSVVITFHNAAYARFIEVGQPLRLSDGTNTEETTVTAYDSSNNTATVLRNDTAFTFAQNSNIAVVTDYAGFLIEHKQGYFENIKIVTTDSNLASLSNTNTEEIEELEVNPRKSILTTDSDEDASKTHTNVVFYDKDDAN